jgi:hypothetical protein
MFTATGFGLAALLAAGTLVQGGEAVSVYTRIDEDCVQTQLPDEPVWLTLCPGQSAGWQVEIISGEHGQAIAYLHAAGTRSDYLNPPMRGLFGGYHDVMEWRLSGGAAFATIHRYVSYNPEDMGAEGPREPNSLIVTALRPGADVPACIAAIVDASSLPDANRVAREAADRLAPRWLCGAEPVWLDADNPDVGAAIAARSG